MNSQEIIDWLLQGDVSIQYQTFRDIFKEEKKELRQRIEAEGWGKEFLQKRNLNGHWGMSFYQPKWISTHYTLLDLRNLNLNPEHILVKETINKVLNTLIAEDGGIQLGPSTKAHSDVCVNAMFLNYASYFKAKEQQLTSIVDSILNELMPDGGFNCRTTRSEATHSSLHTTISVLEGMAEFIKNGNTYRIKDLRYAQKSAEEFILQHQLFMSDKTGEIIKKEFLKIPYPCRWKYDILRALDYFQYSGRMWDYRMEPAINVLQKKKRTDGRWNVQAAHSGKVHFEMEKAGKPSRWNTLRVLRVFKHFGIE